MAGGNQSSEAGSVQTTADTDDRTVSDPERLISYLSSHPQAATAWVQALNSDPTLSWSGGNRVDVRQIPAYIHELTPRHLDEDLRVTDYQFTNGVAVAVQSILQKGSAVFVDARGVSRVRCVSGSPLAPMIRLKRSETYRGTRWPDFQPQRVIVIQRGRQCAHDEYYDGDRCRQIASCPQGEYRGDGGRCDHPGPPERQDVRGLSDEPGRGGLPNEPKQPDSPKQPKQPNPDQPNHPDQA
ncbi:MAG: DUF6777 domain-containing protein, partial [Pseudonocardiaceae bacterium]